MTTEQINKEAMDLLREARERVLIDFDTTEFNLSDETSKLLAPYTSGWCNRADMEHKLAKLQLLLHMAKCKMHDPKVYEVPTY